MWIMLDLLFLKNGISKMLERCVSIDGIKAWLWSIAGFSFYKSGVRLPVGMSGHAGISELTS